MKPKNDYNGKAIVTLLLFLVSVTASAASEPKILYETDKSLLTSTIHVVVLTGTMDDPTGKAGLTNLMAEMMLRGTKKKNRTKFQSLTERLGGSIGVRTGQDKIVFEGRVIREKTKEMLDLISEFLLEPSWAKNEFAGLKTEILNGIENKKNQNARLAGLALRREIFGNSPLEYPVDGGLSTVRNIQLADLQRAYNDKFHRGNLIFLIASPLPESEIKPTLVDIWNKLPDGLRITRKPVPFQIPDRPKLILVQKSDISSGALFLGQIGITANDPLRYTLDAANYSFGGEQLVSRLFKVIRGDLGWTYYIGSSYGALGGLMLQKGLYTISATPSVEYTTKSLLKTLAMWQDYYENGPKDAELLLARDGLVNSYPFEFDTPEKRLGRRLHSFLYDVPTLSPEEYGKVMGAVDNAGVVKALKERHQKEGWVITLVADKSLIEKQLAQEQKEIPEKNRLKIDKVLNPAEVIN